MTEGENWFENTWDLSFLRKQESSVFLFANGGESKSPGFPIKNVGNDRKGELV